MSQEEIAGEKSLPAPLLPSDRTSVLFILFSVHLCLRVDTLHVGGGTRVGKQCTRVEAQGYWWESPQLLSALFNGQGLSLKPRACCCLDSHLASTISCLWLLRPELEVTHHAHLSFTRLLDLNSGPLACAANALSVESSPQPKAALFFLMVPWVHRLQLEPM